MPPEIINAEALVSIAGEWPDFHDAEVLSVALDRGSRPERPALTAVIRTERTLTALPLTVTLLFKGVDDLRLEGFNNQNALEELTIDPIDNPGFELHWDVAFRGGHGMDASFRCAGVIVVDVSA